MTSIRVAAFALVIFLTPTWTHADDPLPAPGIEFPTPRLPRDNLLVYRSADNQRQPVKTTADWAQRRAEILLGMQTVMGRLPGKERLVPLDVKVEEEVDGGAFVRRLITYASERGSRVPAYLCIPKTALKPDAKPVPAVLCLHPTDNRVGHGTVVGLGPRENRSYASELAERGYVTLAPSYPLLANYQPDLKKLGWSSGTLKAVWDNQRSLDLLESLPYVQQGGFGVIGHSLGGHNSVYTAVFDERIKVVVSSCGLDAFVDYYGGDERNWRLEKGWCQTRYMPQLAKYRGRLEEIPFDFHELVAALAPRHVLIIAPTKDDNFRAASVDAIAAAALPIFKLHDQAARLRVEHPDCPHDFPPAMREAAYKLFDEVLRETPITTPAAPEAPAAKEFSLHSFERQQLSDVYYSEGANAGDLNGDGKPDVVYGPYWFEGPAFTTKREIYKPVPQNREGYADNFFSWVHDFNADGFGDVFVVGFPGTPAYVYENPGQAGFDAHWKKHQVFDWVSNESPHFTNLVGDARPELVCTRDGLFGFATIDWEKPFDAWTFHPVSEQVTDKRFGHGLGIGDINGDGRLDLIHAKGWLEQPAESPLTSRWPAHAVAFGKSYGGAEMYAYDIDGDGDNDVITSLAAHEFGLAWFEQTRDGDKVTFKQHTIMGDHPSHNRYGVLFTELHSVNLADIDGDGLKDIVTGKTYYSHHKGSPLWDAGAVVYWFRLVRGKEGVDWVPYKADGEAGIGRQLSLADINGDGQLDIIVGGMKGAHVLRHKKETVDEATWTKAQPLLYQGAPPPSAAGAKQLRGPKAPIDAQTGRVAGALEGESLKHRASGGAVSSQPMVAFKGDRWSGDAQLFWARGRPGDTLTIDLPEQSGKVDVELVLTTARDYAIVQLALDGQPLGKPIDLYTSEVLTTGVLTFSKVELKPGPHTLTVQIVGANPKAAPAYMFGLDYVRWKKSGE